MLGNVAHFWMKVFGSIEESLVCGRYERRCCCRTWLIVGLKSGLGVEVKLVWWICLKLQLVSQRLEGSLATYISGLRPDMHEHGIGVNEHVAVDTIDLCGTCSSAWKSASMLLSGVLR